VKISVSLGDVATVEDSVVIVNLFEGVTNPDGATGVVNNHLDGAITNLIGQGEIKGKNGEITLIHTLGKLPVERVIVLGLGKHDQFGLDVVRAVSAQVIRYVGKLGIKSASTIVHGAGIGNFKVAEAAYALAEGSILGLYQFGKYKSDSDSEDKFEHLRIIELDGSKLGDLEQGVSKGTITANAVNYCRDMVNEPANVMTPTKMSECALEIAKENNVSVEVHDRSFMEDMDMGALIGVTQGSHEPPKLIVLKYCPNPEKSSTIGLLGKGITFDSGGLDLKSASGMREMKGDMAGGAAVIACIKGIAELGLQTNVTAIVPATENMPALRAQRPGDVVKTMSGKTIEIDNTDAEGRLVLADAITYARSIGIDRIVDVATLTGAIVTALGKGYTGLFGNDASWTEDVVNASKLSGENMWELPMPDEYKLQYTSDIADIKNTGGRAAGSITAALIIREFASGCSWVHMDIAGTSMTGSTKGYNPKGPTGVPVRTLIEFISSLDE